MTRRDGKSQKESVHAKKSAVKVESISLHTTLTGILVKSKSEVVIANILTHLGLIYAYEKPLCSKTDRQEFRIPDFTITYDGEEFYWEHLTLPKDLEHKKKWESKLRWYKENKITAQLIVSEEEPDSGINSQEIERLAKERILA